MKVFLTGATGYVGHQLALHLAKKNYKVHALVRDVKSNKVPRHHRIKIFAGDLGNYTSILAAMGGCDYVIHTAAYTNLRCRNIDKFYAINVVGTENVLKAAYKLKVSKVVYTSSLSVFGPSYDDILITESQPRLTSYQNDYELTKKMSEETILRYTQKGLSCITLNVAKIYGPGLKTFSNGVNSLIKLIVKKDLLFVPDHLHVSSNYVFIEDVVKAHILALESEITTSQYIIGGENMSYETLFNKIRNLTKSKIKIVKVNYRLIEIVLPILNAFRFIIGKRIALTRGILKAVFTNRIATSNKAISELNYTPTSFETGMLKTINNLNYS